MKEEDIGTLCTFWKRYKGSWFLETKNSWEKSLTIIYGHLHQPVWLYSDHIHPLLCHSSCYRPGPSHLYSDHIRPLLCHSSCPSQAPPTSGPLHLLFPLPETPSSIFTHQVSVQMTHLRNLCSNFLM